MQLFRGGMIIDQICTSFDQIWVCENLMFYIKTIFKGLLQYTE